MWFAVAPVERQIGSQCVCTKPCLFSPTSRVLRSDISSGAHLEPFSAAIQVSPSDSGYLV